MVAESTFDGMMDEVSQHAEREWRDWADNVEPAMLAEVPGVTFIVGYMFGVGLGLALSPDNQELVRKLGEYYRSKGKPDDPAIGQVGRVIGG